MLRETKELVGAINTSSQKKAESAEDPKGGEGRAVLFGALPVRTNIVGGTIHFCCQCNALWDHPIGMRWSVGLKRYQKVGNIRPLFLIQKLTK